MTTESNTSHAFAICPLCERADAPLQYDLDPAERDLQMLVSSNLPGWEPRSGICPKCLELFRGARHRLNAHPEIFNAGAYRILPTPLRMGADEQYTGRGITIAFLDSGFYFHPDLTTPHNRIKRYVNIANLGANLGDDLAANAGAAAGEAPIDKPTTNADDSWHELKHPDSSSWHGMMTSVVAAGNGSLSGGVYRGIASDANVVLVKVGTANRIHHQDIQRGLEWVLAHQQEYDIRVVNISCAGDYEASYLTDGLSQAAEACVRSGMVLCCAAGNAGHTPDHAILPPASVPAVITVGGFNDKNTLRLADNDLYQSSYGPTIDGLQKPEIIAPSIWIAAPILPDTPTAEAAQLYNQLHNATDAELQGIIAQAMGIDSDLDAAQQLPPYLIRQLVAIKMHDNNVISGHYKHVDGTSFASPIVASVVAQMLEAKPELKPHEVKRILVDTARRLENVAVERQGWGVVLPGLALARVLGNH